MMVEPANVFKLPVNVCDVPLERLSVPEFKVTAEAEPIWLLVVSFIVPPFWMRAPCMVVDEPERLRAPEFTVVAPV